MATLPCKECKSRCCKYVAVPIDTPRSKADRDHIRWYLHHKNVRVFIDHHNTWHLEFVTRCGSLGANGKCMSYELRPAICAVYGTDAAIDECEYYGTPYKHCFTSVEQYEEWLGARNLARVRAERARTRNKAPASAGAKRVAGRNAVGR